ncbi:UNVERIFIED_ORG: hypothetical protein FHR35_003431 [Microbispora rosea subsp. rosea]
MQGDTPGAGMSFAVLGPLDVRRDGRPVEVGGQRLRALLTLAELALGRHADLISELRLLVTAHPLRERPHGQLMRALYVAGRRVEALAAYEEARSVFADRLGADPSPALAELYLAMLRGELSEEGTRPPPAVTPPTGLARSEQVLALKEQALAQVGQGLARLDRPPPRAPRRGNLRARLTSFVGRDDDVGRIGGLLAADRLVTLLGPGGAGKTRLAVESAEAIAAGVPDGVWLVELAPVGDAAEVPQAALTTLGLRDTGLVPVRAVPAVPSAPSGSATGSGCSPAEAVRRCPATRRSAWSWSGAGTCSTPASARSRRGWRCSRAGPRWRPPSGSARATSTCSAGSSGGPARRPRRTSRCVWSAGSGGTGGCPATGWRAPSGRRRR